MAYSDRERAIGVIEMPDATTVNRYLKSEYEADEVEAIRQSRLEDARSCVLTEDETHWILTTVWPGDA
jgi:hypothetical protein